MNLSQRMYKFLTIIRIHNPLAPYLNTSCPIVKRAKCLEKIMGERPLGRWGLEYGETAAKRSNLSNIDHCGTCEFSKTK